MSESNSASAEPKTIFTDRNLPTTEIAKQLAEIVSDSTGTVTAIAADEEVINQLIKEPTKEHPQSSLLQFWESCH